MSKVTQVIRRKGLIKNIVVRVSTTTTDRNFGKYKLFQIGYLMKNQLGIVERMPLQNKYTVSVDILYLYVANNFKQTVLYISNCEDIYVYHRRFKRWFKNPNLDIYFKEYFI